MAAFIALEPSLLLPPLHLLTYSTLLGTQLYQTFVMTKVSYEALPMSAFTSLQKRVFPVYFRMQGLLALAVAVTYPPDSLWGLVGGGGWKELGPVAVCVGMAGLNWMWVGPRVRRIMVERIHQETRDGRRYNERENQSNEMRSVNKRFSREHALTIHLNLIGIGASIWYGIMLGSRLEFGG